MKKVFKVILIIFIILLLLCCAAYRILSGPNVGLKERSEIRKYAESYLINKYGDHNYKITGVRYEYDMDTLFDYSNPVGYWVDFKSDVVPDCWLTINGLISDDYRADNDYFIEDYYFPNMDGYQTHEQMSAMYPKKEFLDAFSDIFKNEFDKNADGFECDYIHLEIPDDYGRIPTLEEIKTDISLYRLSSFSYRVPDGIQDIDIYEEEFEKYIKNKYNVNSDIYFHLDNTLVSVFLEDGIAIQ